jgi:hypothetical protein
LKVRDKPTTVSGEPVDAEVKVHATFEFSQQQGEHKQYVPYNVARIEHWREPEAQRKRQTR